MALTITPEKAWIFRIFHRDNLPWILAHGLHARTGEFCPTYRNIGNTDLISGRSRRLVEVPPGGTLDDYVPFYFTPFSIMMLNIKTGRGVRQVPNEEIMILVSSLHLLQQQGVPFVFTDRHAYPRAAKYCTSLSEIGCIDWDLLQRRDFEHDPDDPAKKERYQAEALAWKHVPLSALIGVCCNTKAVENYAQAEMAKIGVKLKTGIQPRWYF